MIKGVQFDPEKTWPECIIPWKGSKFPTPRDMSFGFIDTPNGKMHVFAGDWIIKGVKGGFYPATPISLETVSMESVLQDIKREMLKAYKVSPNKHIDIALQLLTEVVRRAK